MDTTILIISIITLSISLIFGAIYIYLLWKLKKQDNRTNSNEFDVKELEKNQIETAIEIKMAVTNLEKNISLKMEGELNSKLQAQITEIVKTLKEGSDSDTKRLISFQKSIQDGLTSQISAMNQKIDTSMKAINEKVNQSLNDGFKGTSESMSSLQKQLGMVQEAQKNIVSLQGEISSLKDVLSNNQQRGKYGEFQLEMLLENLFDGSKGVLYDIQYTLEPAKGDEPALKPDAVVFLDGESRQQIICIDSKFSLVGYEDLFDSRKHLSDDEITAAKAAFRGAMKSRIEETSKYIIKGKTISNALMFIPNDGIFAYIHNEFPELIELAKKKGVVMVSPTILQPLLASFRVIQLNAKKNKSIDLINKQLDALGKEFGRFIPRWESLNNNIQSLTKKSESFSKTVQKIGTRFDKVAKVEFGDDDNELLLEDETKQIETDDAFNS